MTTGLNNFALSLLSGADYNRISDAPTKAAVATIATQLQGYRSQATAVSAAGVLRTLVEDILRGQGGQVVENVLPPAAVTENLITDATAATAMGTIRTYLTGLSNANVPSTGALPAKQAFSQLASLIAQAI